VSWSPSDSSWLLPIRRRSSARSSRGACIRRSGAEGSDRRCAPGRRGARGSSPRHPTGNCRGRSTRRPRTAPGAPTECWSESVSRSPGTTGSSKRVLADPIPELTLPAPLTLENLSAERGESTRRARNAAFRDHRGSQPTGVEQWESFMTLPSRRPELSFLALDGEEVVGCVIAETTESDRRSGPVHRHGVRRGERIARLHQGVLDELPTSKASAPARSAAGRRTGAAPPAARVRPRSSR
jgi:hypothetical protein